MVILRELEFDLVLRGGYHSAKPLEPDIAKQQDLIFMNLTRPAIDPLFRSAALVFRLAAGLKSKYN